MSKAYLDRLPNWDLRVAQQRASELGLELTQARAELLEPARWFYDQYGFSPSNRPLISAVAQH